MFEGRTIVDVSRRLVPGRINNTFGYMRELEIEPVVFRLEGFPDSRMSIVKVHSHVGTHVEMPVHRYPDKADVAAYPADKFFTGVRLADVTFAGELAQLTVADIKRATEQDVRPGDTVIIYSRFEPEKRPVITLEVIEWLLDAGMVILGMDSMAGLASDAHDRVLGSDTPILEDLVNLDEVPAKRGTIAILPVAVEGLDAIPVRAVIIV